MNISDYLIAQEDQDWGKLLGPWHWLLPREVTLWLVNRFGDVFYRLPDGSVHRLDVEGGTVTQLAKDRDHFCSIVDEDDNGNDWLFIPLVDECVEAGLHLRPGQCYSFAVPPVLGGDYSASNTRVRQLAVHYEFYARLHRQLKGVPDGSQVTIELLPDV